MLEWIAFHGAGSYGLFFVHDDEDDEHAPSRHGPGRTDLDHSNCFRVHRLLHGTITEMDDPFFGQIWPDLEDERNLESGP